MLWETKSTATIEDNIYAAGSVYYEISCISLHVYRHTPSLMSQTYGVTLWDWKYLCLVVSFPFVHLICPEVGLSSPLHKQFLQALLSRSPWCWPIHLWAPPTVWGRTAHREIRPRALEKCTHRGLLGSRPQWVSKTNQPTREFIIFIWKRYNF